MEVPKSRGSSRIGGPSWGPLPVGWGLLLAALAGAWMATPVLAEIQESGGRSAVEAAPRVGEISIDGRLTEAGWQRVRPAGGFVQGAPIEGLPAQHATEVRLLYDDEAIYVAARMYDAEPERIARPVTRRDEITEVADYFEVSLDSNSDRLTAYSFRVTASGVQMDAYRYDDTQMDTSWDAVWESAVFMDEFGWTAELRIPLSQLRYTAATGPQNWRVNFHRLRVSSNERTYLALESRRQFGGVSAFERIVGLDLPSRTRRLELLPYALGRTHRTSGRVVDPSAAGTQSPFNAGVDLRYGLTSSFVLDATVNPDFGQVEVDPAVINLTALETFFPERRPFFTRDDRLFDFELSGRNRLFYSRRIGRAPQGQAPPGVAIASRPVQTRILGGVKLTGRTTGGLSVGTLAAVTGREFARTTADETGPDRFLVEPRAHHAVVRVRQDLRDGETQVGAIFTGIHRELPSDQSLEVLPSEAFSGGVDFDHSWGNRTWAVTGYFAWSQVLGSAPALVRIQRSPTHYFQRPDAGHLDLDSTATTLSGGKWRLDLRRRSGRNWTGSISIQQRAPGFEIGDLGFSNTSERLAVQPRITYTEIDSGGLLRDYRISASTLQSWRHSVLDKPLSWRSWNEGLGSSSFQATSSFTFRNYWNLSLNGGYFPRVLDDRATRGGPLLLDPGAWNVRTELRTDERFQLSVGPSLAFRATDVGGSRLDLGLAARWRPVPRLEVQLEPEYTRALDLSQYVAVIDDDGFEPTFGRRYIFGELRQHTLSLTTRTNIVLSPTLSFQLFAQPLLSAGDYLTYKQLLRPSSFDFAHFTEGQAEETEGVVVCRNGSTCVSGDRRYLDLTGSGDLDAYFTDRDFNIGSLRSTAVLRWEYRAGSVFHLVWQQTRDSRKNTGDLLLTRDLGDLMDAGHQNVLILKVNYWLGI